VERERKRRIDHVIAQLRAGLDAIRDPAARQETDRHMRQRLDEHYLNLEDLASVRDENDRRIYFNREHESLIDDLKFILRQGLDSNFKKRQERNRNGPDPQSRVEACLSRNSSRMQTKNREHEHDRER
jgi:hypothetical protein